MVWCSGENNLENFLNLISIYWMSPTNDNCHVWTFKLKIVWNFWWIRWKNCLYWVYFKFFVCTRIFWGKKIENGVFPSKLGSKFGFLCPIDFFLSFYKQQKTSVAEMSYLCCAASLSTQCSAQGFWIWYRAQSKYPVLH